MKKVRVTRKEIETIKRFEFSAPYKFASGEIGRVRTEVTINYTKKEFHFLDGGRFYLQNSQGGAVISHFKKGSDLDDLFKNMFEAATAFAQKEISKTNKFIEDGGFVSFEKIGFDTSSKVAAKMRDEIVAFLENNPKQKIELRFGGYARLSSEFAKELFKGKVLEKFLDRIITRQIHVFDQEKISTAIQES
jgi:hypothetical protein